MIKKVSIQNFKSIKQIEFDTQRINVFIGKPNVGKSNILEAIGLLGFQNESDLMLNEVLRAKTYKNLFYFNDTSKPITIKADDASCTLGWNKKKQELGLSINHLQEKSSKVAEPDNSNDELFWEIRADFTFGEQPYNVKTPSPIKFYRFLKNIKTKESKDAFLKVPHGENILYMILENKELIKEVSDIFTEYDLELQLDIDNNTIEVAKRDGMVVTKLPYSLIADTLQRYLFFMTAIYSNEASTLIFEEPENHSYPPYIRDLTYKMILDENDNQFFLSTHSPYVLNNLMENSKQEKIAIFVVDYQNHETTVHQLTDEELAYYMDFGSDIFFNLNSKVND